MDGEVAGESEQVEALEAEQLPVEEAAAEPEPQVTIDSNSRAKTAGEIQNEIDTKKQQLEQFDKEIEDACAEEDFDKADQLQ